MQMQYAVGLRGKPFPDLEASVGQPEIVHMQHTNSVAPCLLDAEIGFCRPRQQIGTALRSYQQLVGKAVADIQACVTRASVYDNSPNPAVLLIHHRLERSREPTLA